MQCLSSRFLAREDRNSPHPLAEAGEDILYEVANDQVGLARATVHDAALKHCARRVPLDVERTAAVGRRTTELQPARRPAWLMGLGDLKQVSLKSLMIALDDFPQAFSRSAVDVNHCLHSRPAPT